jgi:Flp pilus assembly protein TadB
MIKGEPLMHRIRGLLDRNLRKAGIEKSSSEYIKRMLFVSLVLAVLTLLLVRGDLEKFSGESSFFLSLISYFFLFYLGYTLLLSFFAYGWINYKTYSRKKKLESILADYLQLVSANVGAGMPIDQAMWYAVRERFDVLANEIEIVAKKVISGSDLGESLREFAAKYDSDTLSQTVTLLIQGLETGSEIANLLSDIAWNIREGQIMKKEISADIMTYVVFISFASLFAAPLLFALSLKLITIMSGVMGNIDIGDTATGATGFFTFRGNEGMIAPGDFKIFAFTCLGITSIFSSMILSIIRTGNTKDSIKYVPVFILVTFVLFILISAVLNMVFGSLVQIV